MQKISRALGDDPFNLGICERPSAIRNRQLGTVHSSNDCPRVGQGVGVLSFSAP